MAGGLLPIVRWLFRRELKRGGEARDHSRTPFQDEDAREAASAEPLH